MSLPRAAHTPGMSSDAPLAARSISEFTRLSDPVTVPVQSGRIMNNTFAPALSLERVSKDFGSRQALQNVSLGMHPGEFVAVIGRSGAGKTTFLRCLACFTPVTAGAIRFRGQDLAALAGAGLRAHRSRVGMIYQQFNLVRRLPVLYNVLVGRLGHLGPAARWAALAYRFPAGDREIALRCLDHVGLLDRAWQRTDTLSGGERSASPSPRSWRRSRS